MRVEDNQNRLGLGGRLRAARHRAIAVFVERWAPQRGRAALRALWLASARARGVESARAAGDATAPQIPAALFPGDRILARRGVLRTTGLVYVAHSLTPEILKDAIVLRRRDPETGIVAVVRYPSVQDELAEQLGVEVEHWRGFPDLAFRLDRRRARALVAVGRGRTAEALAARLLWSGRFVYRPYPFRHRDAEADPQELAVETWLLKRSDAVYHFFDPGVVAALRERLGFSAPDACLYPACVHELGPRRVHERLSLRDGELHVAYVAGVPSRSDELSPYLVQLPAKLRVLLDAGWHVHLYARGLDAADLHPSLRELARDARLHLERALPFDALLEDLTRFDLGFYHFDLERLAMPPGFERFASNGFFTLLQAGIPPIVSPSTPVYAELASRFGAGLVVTEEGFGMLPSALRPDEIESLRTGVRRAAADLVPDEDALWSTVFGGPSPGRR